MWRLLFILALNLSAITMTYAKVSDQLIVLDATYHYTKQCYSKGRTPYMKTNYGYSVINLSEVAYTFNYAFNIASISALPLYGGNNMSEADIKAELAKNRKFYTNTLVQTGHLKCQ